MGPRCRTIQPAREKQYTNLSAGRHEGCAKRASLRDPAASKVRPQVPLPAVSSAARAALPAPALRRRTELRAPQSVSRPLHVTAGPRDQRRRDLFRSPVPGTSRSLLASASARFLIPLLSSPSAVPALVPGRSPRPRARRCLSLVRAPNKVFSFKSIFFFFFNPRPSLSQLLLRAGTASLPAAGATRV